MAKLKPDIFNSLKARYILFGCVLALLVILVSVYGYQNVRAVSQETKANIETRNQLRDHTTEIHKNMFVGYRALDSFLLDPTRKETREQVHAALQNAQKLSGKLAAYSWISEQNLSSTVQNLVESFGLLVEAAEALMQIRIDPTRQYPSLALGNDVMQPSRNNLNNAIALVMDDPAQRAELLAQPEVYSAFVTMRHLWSQTLSNFRMYLANRVGSFSEESLPIQEKAIETMYQTFMEQVQKLRDYDDDGKLGFEASAAVDEIENSAQRWYKGYLGVKKIHHSDEWRADAKFIQEIISPRLANIDSLLATIERHIEESGNRDVQALASAAKSQTRLLFLSTAAALVFLLLVILSLQRLIFRPIDTVSRALKAEAFGKDGVILPSAHSRETQRLVDAFSEMRKQVHSRQAELEHQALHDSLTELPNRALLQDRMEQAINVARRDHKKITLLMIDLDRFKEINDTLGHTVGDRVLKEVGSRLLHSLRQVDTVARLGGDEYAVLLPNTDIAVAEKIVRKLLTEIETDLVIDELTLVVKTSIGLAEFPTHGEDVSTLLQHADVAMYVAKHGQLGYSIYSPGEDEYNIGRLALIGDLRHAIENNNLELHYQPKVDLETGQVNAVEALLRWHHDQHDYIPPDEIIALAEQTGMIDEITRWVLKESFVQCSVWRRNGIQLDISINISMSNLKNGELIPYIKSLLDEYGLPAKCFTLEITESAMMAKPENALKVLTNFTMMGIKLAIDDFGTGFSSLAYLKKLPVDELKIDKSFVVDLPHDENDLIIVRSTVELAHNLAIDVVAEGIETEAAYGLLKSMKCNSAQGFYISKPLDAQALESFLNIREQA